MAVLEYRAEFDAEVIFTGGGRLRVEGFRIGVPHGDATASEIGSLLVAALGLRSVGLVAVSRVRIFAEPVDSTAVGPAYVLPSIRDRLKFVELSHVVSAGMITYPELPGPEITPHTPRDKFAIDRISMIGNTGTYLDSPYHRYADGTDLAGLPLERLADLPAVVVRAVGGGVRGVGLSALSGLEVAGYAVLLHTGGDRDFGTPRYAVDAPYLTGEAASWLVEHGAALVGIDSVNIDDREDPERPAHSRLLAAGIPIVEHLTRLEDLPPTGARFTAAPPRVAAFGTFPVRAYATIPAVEPHDHQRSAGWLP